MSACTQEPPQPPNCFAQTIPDEYPATLPPRRWPSLIIVSPTLAKVFELVWRPSPVWCCAVCLQPRRAHASLLLLSATTTPPSIISLVANMREICTVCDHLNVSLIFKVLKPTIVFKVYTKTSISQPYSASLYNCSSCRVFLVSVSAKNNLKKNSHHESSLDRVFF